MKNLLVLLLVVSCTCTWAKRPKKVTENDIVQVSPVPVAIKGQTTKDQECLAYSIFREAGNQTRPGQYAVGQVHINRLKSGKWGNSMCKVVYAHAQFSWTLFKLRHKDIWTSDQYAYYMEIADQLINDGVRVKALNNVNIQHYHATYVKPKWRHDGVMVAKAGTHVFYKGVN